jgi:hypothetical protein
MQAGASGSVLKLSSQRLSANDLESLPALLASHPSVTTVDLTDSGVGDGGAALVGSACAASDRGKTLPISHLSAEILSPTPLLCSSSQKRF